MLDAESPEDLIKGVFKYQIKLDSQLNRVKVDLSRQIDFNLIDAFKIFDVDKKGWVNGNDLLTGLTQKIGVLVTHEDLYHFMKRFDRFDTGRLKYSDFCDAFIPIDPVNSNKLCSRKSILKTVRENFFDTETLDLFRLCWISIFANELEFEQMRSSLRKNHHFNPYSCF